MATETLTDNLILTGSYNWTLVVLSYVIAAVSAFVALNFATSLNRAQTSTGKYEIIIAALSLGTGIWVTHFVGMMAYEIPIASSFDFLFTLVSYLAAVTASWLALHVVTSGSITRTRFIISALVFSSAISSMHYLGMLAMRLPAKMTYDMGMVALSIAIAISASFVALYFLLNIRKKENNRLYNKIISAVVIAFGVTGLHYTGMEAMEMELIASMQGMEQGMLDNNLVAIGVGVITVCLMGFNIVIPLINDKKAGKERIVFVLLTMATTTAIIVLATIGFLYKSTYIANKNHLVDIAKTNASLIDAVARFDKKFSEGAGNKSAREATIGQVIDALQNQEKLSYGTDIMLVGDKGENINIIYSESHHNSYGDLQIEKTEYSKQNPLTYPFVQALSGKSGIMVINDLVLGGRILIAYEPVVELGVALVVETHMDEIWAPFKHAIYLTFFISMIVITAGSWLIYTINIPVIKRLEKEIEDKIEAQDELHQINITLEERVSERTIELEATNIQLAEEAREREHTEIALRESHQFQEKILDSSTNSIFVLNPKGGLARINPSLVTLIGFSYSDLIYSDFFKFIHSDKRDEVKELFKSVIDKGEVIYNHESLLVKEDGSTSVVLLSLAPMYEKGTVFSVVGTMDDITEQRMVMNALKIEKENAEYANRAKSEFLANMSHEIRTPMNGVLGMLAILKDSKMSHEQTEYVKTAIDSGETLLALLNDILDLSKIESGKLDFERAEFDLRSIVEDSAALFAKKAHNKNVELAVHVAVSVPDSVIGDQTRLRQILMNLLSNAIKFTDNGEVVISVEATSINNKSKLLFKVKDTGCGISQQQQDKIFDSFTQADGSTTRRYGGTGLGLTICRQLIGLMDGEIGIESEEHKGSTFWFAITLEKGTGTVHIFSPNKELMKLNVLIVDDNATNRAILEYQLRNWGIKYESSDNPFDAIEKYNKASSNKNAFNLLLIDYMMPGMNGIEMVEEMKRYSPDNKPLIIMLSSAITEDIRDRAKETGIHKYLNKPVRQSYLYNSILDLVHNMDNPIKKVTKRKKHKVSSKVSDITVIDSDLKLLVAEDNLINQKVINGLLKKLGYQSVITNNGLEVMQALEKDDYDIILMDCQMPIMDGFMATQEIRNMNSNKNKVTIIAMTANAMQGDRERCLDCGMDDYMTKPLDFDRLRIMLEKHITSRGKQINLKNASV